MDPTRISIARVLELDVPLTWQDAVAVAQEAAMVDDVNAAMNDRASVVSPPHCYITTDGEVDLPESADAESPGGVATLLRAMLQGRDAPAELNALARRHADDLFGQLAAFPVGQRRPIIAQLAERALSRHAALQTAGAVASEAAARPRPPLAPTGPSSGRIGTQPASPPHEPIPPPFVSGPATAVTLGPSPAETLSSRAPRASRVSSRPDAELRRLRGRALARPAGGKSWTARISGWISWRPAFPDPRLLGGATIVLAAIASGIWYERAPAPPGPLAGELGDSVVPASTPSVPPAGSAASAAADAISSPRPGAPRPAPANGSARRPAEPVATGSGRSALVRPNPDLETPLPARPVIRPSPTPPAPRQPPPLSARAPSPSSIVVPAIEDPLPPAPAPADANRRDRTEIYTAQDVEVTPPVLRRRQLPSPLFEPGAEIQPGGPYLELLIDDQGVVEQVRLRARQPAPGQTWYRHRMLLAAAKAWQFEPARLEGRAVRYAMRVPLEP